MRKRWLLSIVIMLFPFVASFAADPEEGTYPTVGRLFHIARSVNKNLVCYDVNLRSLERLLGQSGKASGGNQWLELYPTENGLWV